MIITVDEPGLSFLVTSTRLLLPSRLNRDLSTFVNVLVILVLLILTKLVPLLVLWARNVRLTTCMAFDRRSLVRVGVILLPNWPFLNSMIVMLIGLIELGPGTLVTGTSLRPLSWHTVFTDVILGEPLYYRRY